MTVETFYAEITGNADGLVRAAGAGTAASDDLESSLTRNQGGMRLIGSAAEEHVGGKAVKNVSLLDKAFGGVFNSIKNVIGSMISMVGQTAGIGALFGGAAGLAEGVKLAGDYNTQMALIAATYKNVGQSVPTAQLQAMLDKETALGFTETDSLPGLLELAQAHINVSEQMQVEATAADLARAKNISLADATDLILKAAQGTGKGLQDLGINLPAVVPKTAALTSATAALHKAQQAYQLDLEKYGPQSVKTVAANEALSSATQKVSTDTAAMKDHFSQIPATLSAINSAVGGSAAAYTAQNPLATMGSDLESIARVAGEALLPDLDKFAGWVKTNEPVIKTFTTNAIKDLGTAAEDAGGFVKNDLYPPVHDVVEFVVNNAGVFETAIGALTGLYAIKKVGSGVSTVFGDVKGLVNDLGHVTSLLGGGGSAVSKLAPVDVYVTNPGFGGVGSGSSTGEPTPTGGTSLIEQVAGWAGVAAAAYYVTVLATERGKGTSVLDTSNRGANGQNPGDARFGALVTGEQQTITTNYQQLANQTGLTLAAAKTLAQDEANGTIKGSGAIQDFIRNWQSTNESMGEIDANAALLNQTMSQNVAAFRQDLATSAALIKSGVKPGSAHALAGGGVIREPIAGYGLNSGDSYLIGENGPEAVVPLSGGSAVGPNSGSTGGGNVTVSVGQIVVPVTGNPQATAVAVRNEILSLVGRGVISGSFPR